MTWEGPGALGCPGLSCVLRDLSGSPRPGLPICALHGGEGSPRKGGDRAAPWGSRMGSQSRLAGAAPYIGALRH